MRYFYDFEFLEDGKTIAPISIGIVADDSRTYYAVNRHAPWSAIRRNPWLLANVVSHLPRLYGDARNHMPSRWLFNMNDPAVKPIGQIAAEVSEFLTAAGPCELWGYYSAYDHVCLAQLWGTMVNLPTGIPMWTNDVQQLAAQLEIEGLLPAIDAAKEHNALEDARWTRLAHAYCLDRMADQRSHLIRQVRADDE